MDFLFEKNFGISQNPITKFLNHIDLPITAEQSAELNFGPGSHGFEVEKNPENAGLSFK